jgi:hypothetical protein
VAIDAAATEADRLLPSGYNAGPDATDRLPFAEPILGSRPFVAYSQDVESWLRMPGYRRAARIFVSNASRMQVAGVTRVC